MDFSSKKDREVLVMRAGLDNFVAQGGDVEGIPMKMGLTWLSSRKPG
jgi:hypothetical protein